MGFLDKLLGKWMKKEPIRARPRFFMPQLETLERRDTPSVYTVTNTSGSTSVAGSLPYEVNQANDHPGLNYIYFDIQGAGTQVITITSSLWINNQTVIDGTTQPGYNGVPLISVQGTSAVPGLFIFNSNPSLGTTSSSSTLQGLDLYGYTSNAVTILNVSQGDYIQNNYVGFYNNNGSVELNATLYNPSAGYYTIGIAFQSSYDTIRNNTISGNYNALAIGENPAGTWSGTSYHASGVEDNMIGTDPTGTTDGGYGNLSNALFLGHGAQGNFLGPYNVLSGNGTNAVEFLANSVTQNVLFSNAIGTDVTGMHSIANGWAVAYEGGGSGVLIANGAYGNCIGGPFGGNIISGNGAGGVVLGYSTGTATGNYVQDNIIGLNANQSAVVGSQGVGVTLAFGASYNVVTNNVIAGTTNNGVAITSATNNNVSNNWLGESAYGVFFPIAAFGSEIPRTGNAPHPAIRRLGLPSALPMVPITWSSMAVVSPG